MTNDYYQPSKIQRIDKTQYEDYGNLQGATHAIKRLTGYAVRRPANPTKMYTIKFTAASDISRGTMVTVNLANFGYNNVYDCTTWENYYPSNGYDYLGYFASAHRSQQETKTVLARGGATALQNFAFDGMEDLDI